MCIAVPMQILDSQSTWAWCRDGGDSDRRERVDLRLVGPQPPGTWLLVFLGAAREVIDEVRAMQTLDALEALRAVQQGASVEHLFADLTNREPELPEHLKQQLPAADADPQAAATAPSSSETTTAAITEVPTP